MVLCYENTVLLKQNTYPSLFIMKMLNCLSYSIQYVVFFKIILYLCTTPYISYYCFTCTAFYFFVRTPTNQVLND